MPSATFEIFRRAIEQRLQVTCRYQGHHRELCPHVLGWSEGQERALAFQFAGQTSTALPPGGAWRCLRLDLVQDAGLRAGAWHAGPDKGGPQGCVAEIAADVGQGFPHRKGRAP